MGAGVGREEAGGSQGIIYVLSSKYWIKENMNHI